jgi:hypothetical protein
MSEAAAIEHMLEQNLTVRGYERMLEDLWDRMVDPRDFDRTFRAYREAAADVMALARYDSEQVADRYYRRTLLDAGIEDRINVPRQPEARAATIAAMSRATDPAYTDRLLRQAAADPAVQAAIMSAARSRMTGSAKRRILLAGRERLSTVAARDPNVRGWARVGDGNVCSFCAMLISRGPVYSRESVRFRAHDGCGCGQRLIMRGDPGMTDEARRFRAMYRDGTITQLDAERYEANRDDINARRRARYAALTAARRGDT